MASEWKKIKLGEIGRIITGKTPSSKQKELFFGSGTSFVTPRDMDCSKYIFNTERALTREGVQSVKKSLLPENSIMVSCIGSDMGKVAIAGKSCVTNQQINSIIVKTSYCAEYVYYDLFLRQNEIKSKASGSAVPILNKSHFSELSIKTPPLPVQRAIAHILGSLDDKIELNRRMNETLEAMAAAVFKSWFVNFDPVHAKAQGRDPHSFQNSKLGPIPMGWKATTLKDGIEIFDNKRIPLNKHQRSERQGPYPYYGAASIMDYVNDYLFDGIYVLMGEDGSVQDDDGHPVVQYIWGKFWVNNHAHILQGKNGISTEQLSLFLKQTHIQPFVTGAVQPKLNQKNMKSVPMVLPSEPVCKAFSDTVQPLFAKVRTNREESQTLEALRNTLLPKLISGELDMSNLAIEEAGNAE